MYNHISDVFKSAPRKDRIKRKRTALGRIRTHDLMITRCVLYSCAITCAQYAGEAFSFSFIQIVQATYKTDRGWGEASLDPKN